MLLPYPDTSLPSLVKHTLSICVCVIVKVAELLLQAGLISAPEPCLPPHAPPCCLAVLRQVEASAAVIDEMMGEISREMFLGAAVAHVTGESGC